MIAPMAPDPIAKLVRWFAAARRSRMALPEAMALATADGRGAPSVRYVLLKAVDPRGLVFFTDGRSRKGAELARRPRAAVAFYWHTIGKQVRVEGRVEAVPADEADAYWESRPRGSRLAAASATQSAAMPSHAWLLARWRKLRGDHAGGRVPRPPAWGGYRIVPDAVEFWTRGAHRLHLRERYQRTRRGWKRTLLQP
jgi:pyridoxamine 5'-phosphate oxidase